MGDLEADADLSRILPVNLLVGDDDKPGGIGRIAAHLRFQDLQVIKASPPGCWQWPLWTDPALWQPFLPPPRCSAY